MCQELVETIQTVKEAQVDALCEFYHRMYPHRRQWSRVWAWAYRWHQGGSCFPLVVTAGDQVIAQAGGIPFTAVVHGRRCRAAWFVDFAVLPEFQRRGIGRRLTEAWMDQSELCVTFCNEKSMGVFRRYGWIESLDTALCTMWLRPLDHPAAARVPSVLRSSANRLASLPGRLYYAGLAKKDMALRPLAKEESAVLVDQDTAEAATPVNEVRPLRDAQYCEWRVGRSPWIDTYRLGRVDSLSVLARVSNSPVPGLTVLWLSDVSEPAYPAVMKMLASLARLALREGYSFVRYWAGPRLQQYLRPLRARATPVRFAYWTRDRDLLNNLHDATWHWQLIDSDFETTLIGDGTR